MAAPERSEARKRRGAAWTLAELKQVGKVPDSVLARRTGRTIKEVVAQREHRRVRLPTPPRRWTASELRMLGWKPEELRLVGKLRDEEVAACTGHTVTAVHNRRRALGLPMPQSKIYRWKPEHDKL